MLKYCSLYSGSSGNSFFVQSDKTKILIDAGVSSKKIVMALEELNVSIEKINGILVTHEHIDHTKSLATLSNKYNIPVYANKKTWEAIKDISDKIATCNKKTFNMLEKFEIGDLQVFAFKTPHDAADPCGFNIYNCNKKISIATDLGSINEELLGYLKNSSSILLEANYDPDILKCSRYPYLLKERISGKTGHLSNSSAGKLLANLCSSGLHQALLIHLSKENNFPELAYQTITDELSNNKNVNISIAPRNRPSDFFEVS